MPPSDAEKSAMIAATRQTAAAMLDDLEHIRSLIQRPDLSPGDIRRMSGLLRRILIDNDGDIRKVAPPRIGRVMLLAPDTRALERLIEKHSIEFAAVGEYYFNGWGFAGLFADDSDLRNQKTTMAMRSYVPGQNVTVNQDSFLGQTVIYHMGVRVRRGDVIRYIANVASGVHSSDPKEASHVKLKNIRQIFSLFKNEEGVTVRLQREPLDQPETPLALSPGQMDFALLQLLSTANYLVTSPGVLKLEEAIRQEAT